VHFDVDTLLTLMLANVFAMAVALPFVIGWRVSGGARCVLASALAQALAWGCFLLARPVHDRLFSTLWIALLGASFVAVWHALERWLGGRPGRNALYAVALLTPLGYGLGFESYAFRTGWSNLGLATLMVLVGLACAWPAPHASRRWRGLLLACFGSLAALTLARGVLGAFFTSVYPALRAPHPVNIAGALLNHIVLTLSTIALLVGWHEEAEAELRRQATTDGLTGLLNRRAWLQRSRDVVELARRHGEPVCLLMIDIDHFKAINDVRGHEVGDRALQTLAAVLSQCARRGDLVCRYGGEEFCVLLPHTEIDGARNVDARIRAHVRADCDPAHAEPLSFSSGLATFQGRTDSLDGMLRRADEAMYEAKAAGRDRLVLADERALRLVRLRESRLA
jgi:diguanylate cyclase (GGDEF)-like protein